ncbi:MAG: hypothetical protein B7C24_18150, partial [Bacteroidetes bacterium 4572_77]
EVGLFAKLHQLCPDCKKAPFFNSKVKSDTDILLDDLAIKEEEEKALRDAPALTITGTHKKLVACYKCGKMITVGMYARKKQVCEECKNPPIVPGSRVWVKPERLSRTKWHAVIVAVDNDRGLYDVFLIEHGYSIFVPFGDVGEKTHQELTEKTGLFQEMRVIERRSTLSPREKSGLYVWTPKEEEDV